VTDHAAPEASWFLNSQSTNPFRLATIHQPESSSNSSSGLVALQAFGRQRDCCQGLKADHAAKSWGIQPSRTMAANSPTGLHPASLVPSPPALAQRAGLQGKAQSRRIANLPLRSPSRIRGPVAPTLPPACGLGPQRALAIQAICSRLLPAKVCRPLWSGGNRSWRQPWINQACL
jgi:hypothetical protein